MQYLIINELEINQYLKEISFLEKILDQNIDPRAFNMTITEPIGPSLKELFIACDRQFSIKTILMIGLKLVKQRFYKN